MAKSNLFEKCIEVILKSEGGFQNDINDYGNWTGPNCTGELLGTKYGIAARYFYEIVKQKFNTNIRNLSQDQAIEIYYEYFWVRMNIEGIDNENLVLHIFDHGINSNRKYAIRMLQRIIGAEPDGICGPVTTWLANSVELPNKKIEGYGLLTNSLDYYIFARYNYYIGQFVRYPKKRKFIIGWYNRIATTHF